MAVGSQVPLADLFDHGGRQMQVPGMRFRRVRLTRPTARARSCSGTPCGAYLPWS
jgi:hypothetical protein